MRFYESNSDHMPSYKTGIPYGCSNRHTGLTQFMRQRIFVNFSRNPVPSALSTTKALPITSSKVHSTDLRALRSSAIICGNSSSRSSQQLSAKKVDAPVPHQSAPDRNIRH